MTDYYYTASTQSPLATLAQGYRLTLPPDGIPKQGIAADPEAVNPDGSLGTPQIGNPSLFYLAIRTPDAITAPPGVTDITATPTDGISVIGVWE